MAGFDWWEEMCRDHNTTPEVGAVGPEWMSPPSSTVQSPNTNILQQVLYIIIGHGCTLSQTKTGDKMNKLKLLCHCQTITEHLRSLAAWSSCVFSVRSVTKYTTESLSFGAGLKVRCPVTFSHRDDTEFNVRPCLFCNRYSVVTTM